MIANVNWDILSHFNVRSSGHGLTSQTIKKSRSILACFQSRSPQNLHVSFFDCTPSGEYESVGKNEIAGDLTESQ